MPGCVLVAGIVTSRTSFPFSSLTRSLRSVTGFFTKYSTTASFGGFSPTKYWCPQNSSLRSSFVFHSSAAGGVKSFAAAPDARPVGRLTGPGFRYITVQVFDVDQEHAGILARGGSEGRPPLTLGKVARISFVRDPDGNWIEISQRASLTGPLPQR